MWDVIQSSRNLMCLPLEIRTKILRKKNNVKKYRKKCCVEDHVFILNDQNKNKIETENYHKILNIKNKNILKTQWLLQKQ